MCVWCIIYTYKKPCICVVENHILCTGQASHKGWPQVSHAVVTLGPRLCCGLQNHGVPMGEHQVVGRAWLSDSRDTASMNSWRPCFASMFLMFLNKPSTDSSQGCCSCGSPRLREPGSLARLVQALLRVHVVRVHAGLVPTLWTLFFPCFNVWYLSPLPRHYTYIWLLGLLCISLIRL